jgi:sucrose-6-phosphate hydrolase SacC (GH32 family)
VQAPIDELKTLRTAAGPRTVTGDAPLPGSADIEIEVTRGEWREAGLKFLNASGESAVVGINADPLELFIDRRVSRATTFHADYPGRHTGPVRWRDNRVALRVLFDRTVLEVFANDGESVMTDRVYPTQPFDRIELLHAPGERPAMARMWEMRSIWQR